MGEDENQGNWRWIGAEMREREREKKEAQTREKDVKNSKKEAEQRSNNYKEVREGTEMEQAVPPKATDTRNSHEHKTEKHHVPEMMKSAHKQKHSLLLS